LIGYWIKVDFVRAMAGQRGAGQPITACFLRHSDTIKLGMLQSLFGTIPITRTTLKDTMPMLIEAQNAKGGV
jgi:urea transport system substrate-binding protein